MWRGRTWHGRAGQAFKLCEPGVVNGTTANSLFASYRGPRQDDQVVKTKFLARNCLRILDQGLGPTRAPSRLNRPLEDRSRHDGRARFKGGLDIPSTHARCNSLRMEHPLRTLACRVWSRTGRVGIAVFASHSSLLIESAPLVVHRPIEQGPGRGAVRSKVIRRCPKLECVLNTNGRDS